jgi:hypothetical protein
VTGSPRVTVYLVPMRLAKSGAHQRSTGPPRDSRWIRIGPLLEPGSQTGREAHLSFVLPGTLPPNDYTTGFWCRPCAPPKGATFTSAQPGQSWSPDARLQTILRVLPLTPASPNEALAPASESEWRWLALAGVACVLVASGFLIHRYARREPTRTR